MIHCEIPRGADGGFGLGLNEHHRITFTVPGSSADAGVWMCASKHISHFRCAKMFPLSFECSTTYAVLRWRCPRHQTPLAHETTTLTLWTLIYFSCSLTSPHPPPTHALLSWRDRLSPLKFEYLALFIAKQRDELEHVPKHCGLL